MSIHWGGRGAGHVSRWSLAPTGAPALELNFLSGALDPRITFTRSTTATFFGSNGLIQSSAIDAPRFDYNPTTLEARGLLIEEQRVNLLLRSEEFEDATWNKSGTTITANNIASPDGTVDADKATANAALSLHIITQARSVTAATVYTVSFFVKAAGYTKVGIREGNLTGAYATFNLATGTKIDQGVGGVGSITLIRDGWYRIDMVATSGGASFRADISILDPAYTSGPPTGTWTGDGTSGIYVWGSQLEAGAFASSYIPTVASTVTRAADLSSMTGTNFSNWYTSAQGTFVVSADVKSVASGDKYVVTVSDGNGRVVYVSGSSINTFDGTTVTSSAQSAVANTPFKAATAWSGSTLSISAKGAAAVGGAFDGAFGAGTSLRIGSNAGSTSINGHVQAISFYNTRLLNTQLQVLTA